MAPEEEFMAIRDIFMANIQSKYKEYYYWEVQIWSYDKRYIASQEVHG